MQSEEERWTRSSSPVLRCTRAMPLVRVSLTFCCVSRPRTMSFSSQFLAWGQPADLVELG